MLSRTQFSAICAALLALSLAPAPALAIVGKTDDVLIDANGFDFGGAGTSNDQPAQPGKLEWDQSAFGLRATLTGVIRFTAVADSCARMQIRSFTRHGVEVGEPSLSNEVCAFGDGHTERSIEVSAEFGASRVEIALQTQADDRWGSVGKHVTVDYGPELASDQFRIEAHEVDFGDGDFVDHAPSGNALVRWLVVEDDKIMPVLTGTLYMENADELCAQIRAEYKSIVFGTTLATVDSPRHCATKDKLYTFSIPLSTEPAKGIEQVTYTLRVTTRGSDEWHVRGEPVTVSLGES